MLEDMNIMNPSNHNLMGQGQHWASSTRRRHTVDGALHVDDGLAVTGSVHDSFAELSAQEIAQSWQEGR